MTEQETLDMIALSMVPGVGPLLAKRILEHSGNASELFKMNPSELLRIPDIGPSRIKGFFDPDLQRKAERELAYIQREGIRIFFLEDSGYPERLKQCSDAPLVFFLRGSTELDAPKVLSVIGTRRASPYGLEQCRKLISSLAAHHPELLVISGLAYGIDHAAHQAALDAGLQTVGVLAHGLKYLYPALHRGLARRIVSQGALLTDFPADEGPIPQHFIKRNRLIAGLSDAVVVVESGLKGGALITADLAMSYDREVYAFPGRVNDRGSAGCNRLIRTNQAALIERAEDFSEQIGWSRKKAGSAPEDLFDSLGPQARQVIRLLESEGSLAVDRICARTGLPLGRLSVVLLELELKGRIRIMPGDQYQLV